ncbi:TPA: O-unit flippase-like protein [Vibrio parahaemolyticus]
MINKANRKDIVWGYLAQFLNIGSGIVIIPIAIKYLTTEDMGLWYLFIALVGLAQLLEFGFQPTISRMTSYVYSGASELKSEGVPKREGNLDVQLLYDLIFASKSIYKFVSIGAALILLVCGTIYLNSFESFGKEQLFSWIIFSSSAIVNFYFSYFNGLITGRGQQKELYRITAISKSISLLVSVPLLIFGVGLLSMAIGSFLSMIITRLLLYRYFYNKNREEIKALLNIKTRRVELTKTLWLSAWKLGVTGLGSFLILRANMFIASSFLGLKVAASYGLSVQVISILSSVSAMVFTLNVPKLNSLQGLGDKNSIKDIFYRSLFVTHILYVIGGLLLILVGMPILELISPNTMLVSLPILLFMLFMYQLELNHSVCATYLTTFNKVPFLHSSIISGILITISGIITSNFTNFGVLGLLGGQFFIQLLYNNWYWPLVAYRSIVRGY